jgi:hypothetical protein
VPITGLCYTAATTATLFREATALAPVNVTPVLTCDWAVEQCLMIGLPPLNVSKDTTANRVQ